MYGQTEAGAQHMMRTTRGDIYTHAHEHRRSQPCNDASDTINHMQNTANMQARGRDPCPEACPKRALKHAQKHALKHALKHINDSASLAPFVGCLPLSARFGRVTELLIPGEGKPFLGGGEAREDVEQQ